MITKEELTYLREIATRSSDLVRAYECEVFEEFCGGIQKLKEAHIKSVVEYEHWLEEQGEIYY